MACLEPCGGSSLNAEHEVDRAGPLEGEHAHLTVVNSTTLQLLIDNLDAEFPKLLGNEVRPPSPVWQMPIKHRCSIGETISHLRSYAPHRLSAGIGARLATPSTTAMLGVMASMTANMSLPAHFPSSR